MAKVLVICGATASGKTSLSVACAKAFHGEVISADSLLVYKGLNVGTAKPSMEEREGVPHHLIDVVSPKESFSVSDYEAMALPIVEKLLLEGNKVSVLDIETENLTNLKKKYDCLIFYKVDLRNYDEVRD